ncbi:MAG: dihydroorotate dehydrogenase electron transfer subunit [Clostridia bacterium]|nr:dihydroorotate dehydrogenase electron transfer subunit [Clostridia bacterium]
MKEVLATVLENKRIAENIQSLTFSTGEVIPVRAGQFLNISTGNGVHLLRRPIAVCKAEGENITICFQLKGEGTHQLALVPAGAKLSVLLPLGNGFFVEESEQKVALVAGGVGIFPIISVIREYAPKGKQIHSYIGFRNRSAICCLDKLEKSTALTVTTDDGSYGLHMNAVQAFVADMDRGNVPDVVLSCGPTPMLKALQAAMQERDIPCYVSLEERMGCGIGACLVCVCNQTNGTHARVCKDGPVFNAKDVQL